MTDDTPAPVAQPLRTLETYIIRAGDPAMGTPTWQSAMDALDALRAALDAPRSVPDNAAPDPHEPCQECGAWLDDHAVGCPALTRKMQRRRSVPDNAALREALVGLRREVVRLKHNIPRQLVMPQSFFRVLGDVNIWLDKSEAALAAPASPAGDAMTPEYELAWRDAWFVFTHVYMEYPPPDTNADLVIAVGLASYQRGAEEHLPAAPASPAGLDAMTRELHRLLLHHELGTDAVCSYCKWYAALASPEEASPYTPDGPPTAFFTSEVP